MAAEYAVLTGTLPTSVSSYTNYTSSGFGTPVAAILFACAANTANNPNSTGRFSIGFWTASAQNSCGTYEVDNVADSATRRGSDDSYGMMIQIGNAAGESWYTVSSITDGIRVTMSIEDSDITGNIYCTCVLLKGISASTGTFTPNSTQNGTQASASLGFAPKLVLFSSIGNAGADVGAQANAIFSFGFAESNSTHRCIRWWNADASATMDNRLKFDEDRCCGQENTWSLEITTWGSDTFTATTRDGATGSDVCFYLALGGDDLKYDVGTLTTRTTTGDTVISTTNVPDTALICLSTATGTTRHTDSGANGFMVGAGKGTVEYAHNVSSEDAAATSNANSAYSAAQILNLDSSASGSRTDLCDATAVFNTSDVTLTYSAVDATARKGWYLIFGQPATTTTNARKMYHYMHH